MSILAGGREGTGPKTEGNRSEDSQGGGSGTGAQTFRVENRAGGREGAGGRKGRAKRDERPEGLKEEG